MNNQRQSFWLGRRDANRLRNAAPERSGKAPAATLRRLLKSTEKIENLVEKTMKEKMKQNWMLTLGAISAATLVWSLAGPANAATLESPKGPEADAAAKCCERDSKGGNGACGSDQDASKCRLSEGKAQFAGTLSAATIAAANSGIAAPVLAKDAERQAGRRGDERHFEPATERTPVIARYEKLQYGMWINFGMMSMTGEHFTKIRTSPLPPPETYNPTQLDVDQWIATAKKAGMRFAVLDTKGWHGFCLWNSKTTDYDVAASPVKTDVVVEFVEACRKHGIAPCFNFSFVDASYEQRTGRRMFDRPDDYAKKQLTELLTNYGPITTVWFDGMGGGDFPEERIRRAYDTVKLLQPDCLVVMHAPGAQNEPLRRWPTDVVQFGQSLPPQAGHNPWLKHDGKTYYIPMEVLGWVTNLALRKVETWTTRPLATLVDIYHRAIGRGANLAMLVWPNRQGRLPADQVERLLGLAETVKQQKVEATKGKVLRHLVFFKYKETASPKQIRAVIDALRALPSKIDSIQTLQWGTNNSPAGLDDGFIHGFVLTFKDEAGRKKYLPHPDHRAVGKVIGPIMKSVFVIDY